MYKLTRLTPKYIINLAKLLPMDYFVHSPATCLAHLELSTIPFVA